MVHIKNFEIYQTIETLKQLIVGPTVNNNILDNLSPESYRNYVMAIISSLAPANP